MTIILSLAFLASALTMPWWVCVPLAVLLLAYGKGYWAVIVGGVLRDLLFATPQPALFGFSMIYTSIFALLALLAWYLHLHMLER